MKGKNNPHRLVEMSASHGNQQPGSLKARLQLAVTKLSTQIMTTEYAREILQAARIDLKRAIEQYGESLVRVLEGFRGELHRLTPDLVDASPSSELVEPVIQAPITSSPNPQPSLTPLQSPPSQKLTTSHSPQTSKRPHKRAIDPTLLRDPQPRTEDLRRASFMAWIRIHFFSIQHSDDSTYERAIELILAKYADECTGILRKILQSTKIRETDAESRQIAVEVLRMVADRYDPKIHGEFDAFLRANFSKQFRSLCILRGENFPVIDETEPEKPERKTQMLQWGRSNLDPLLVNSNAVTQSLITIGMRTVLKITDKQFNTSGLHFSHKPVVKAAGFEQLKCAIKAFDFALNDSLETFIEMVEPHIRSAIADKIFSLQQSSTCGVPIDDHADTKFK